MKKKLINKTQKEKNLKDALKECQYFMDNTYFKSFSQIDEKIKEIMIKYNIKRISPKVEKIWGKKKHIGFLSIIFSSLNTTHSDSYFLEKNLSPNEITILTNKMIENGDKFNTRIIDVFILVYENKLDQSIETLEKFKKLLIKENNISYNQVEAHRICDFASTYFNRKKEIQGLPIDTKEIKDFFLEITQKNPKMELEIYSEITKNFPNLFYKSNNCNLYIRHSTGSDLLIPMFFNTVRYCFLDNGIEGVNNAINFLSKNNVNYLLSDSNGLNIVEYIERMIDKSTEFGINDAKIALMKLKKHCESEILNQNSANEFNL